VEGLRVSQRQGHPDIERWRGGGGGGPAPRGAAVDATEAAQARRDRLDAAQSQMAADAVLLDATELTLAKVIEEIARLARERSELACTGDKRS